MRPRLVPVWLAVTAALSCCGPSCRATEIPPSVLPGLGDAARREAVDVEQPPWRGVVRVQTEVGIRCTGGLVGPRVVVTAAHCLFGGTARLVRPGTIHVLTGYSHGSFAGHARAVSVVIGPGFAVGPDRQRRPGSPPDADWAILTLDAPLGTPDRVLPLISAVSLPGTPAMLGGFEQDRAQVLVADVDCRIGGEVRAAGAVLLRHSCAATRGASGAPLLARNVRGGWGVVGIASVAAVGVAGGLAVPTGRIFAEAAGMGERR